MSTWRAGVWRAGVWQASTWGCVTAVRRFVLRLASPLTKRVLGSSELW